MEASTGLHAGSSGKLTPPKILVAEDDPAGLELVRGYLSAKGYDVAAAYDGNRTLHLAGSGEFDLLVLDVHMPLYEGVEVLHMLRKRFLRHPLKIIAVTADSGSDLRDKLTRGGVDSYLTKPLDLEILGEEVTRLLAMPDHVLPHHESGRYGNLP